MKARKRLWQGFMKVSCGLVLAAQLLSQSFIDPFQVRYTYGSRNTNAAATPFDHLWTGCDLPVKLKENSYIILSPTYEQWQIDSADKKEIYPKVHSFSFPVSYVMPFQNSKWSFTIVGVPRWNGKELFAKNTFQLGGAALAIYALRPYQKFRLGMYVNSELFGLFIIPLAGVDWRMDDKNYLFGNLPGRLTYEHQWSDKLYGGATFRSITNSYRLSEQYLRLEDNQVSLYLDYYLIKNVCITMEPGYGLFRKIRTGIHKKDYLTDIEWGDGVFIKVSGSYRIRL